MKEKVIQFLLSKVDKNLLKKAVEQNSDISELIYNSAIDFLSSRIPKFILRTYWHEIEPYLTDVEKLKSVLAKREDLREIIEHPNFDLWLYNILNKVYPKLYDWVWG